MTLGFSGEVADYYQRYRRGYPPEVLDALAAACTLTPADIALDLGCGTGQLTIPMAARVRAVIGMDPEPDMLTRARTAEAPNVTWVLGADTDVPKLGTLVNDIGIVTVGQALHWMDHEKLFDALFPLVRTGGGVAVLSNGTPLWLQDTPWSHALRGVMEQWLGTTLTNTCGTDQLARDRYRASMINSGFEVRGSSVDYTDHLTVDQIIGGVYSALPEHRLPTDRAAFETLIRDVLAPHAPYIEHINVVMVLGIRSER
ncbi:MAG: class I SAM-dependent methyltransferase [Kibdelosporangium sp.]